MAGYRIELYKGLGRQPWRLRVKAANGEIIFVSEGYATKWNAKRAARKNFRIYGEGATLEPIEVSEKRAS